ncbi:MAG: hypothetical protein HLX50_13275 [Alteromonadaceae bacterium]|nr:hypothetical protein [Alteromonadaceae bacterium]
MRFKYWKQLREINLNRLLPRSFTNLELDRKITVIGGLLGLISFTFTFSKWFIEESDLFKSHQLKASIIRPQETLSLNAEDTLGNFIIFKNSGDYPEIVTRVRAELYLPFKNVSLYPNRNTPNILPLQIDHDYIVEEDGRIGEFLFNGGYINKGSSRLPHFVDLPDYKNILAFGGKLDKGRYVLESCNESFVITNKTPQNIITKETHFKFPKEVLDTINEHYFLVESGVYDQSVFSTLSNEDFEVEYFLGELVIVIEFINSDGKLDRRLVDGSNVHLIVSKNKKLLHFSDWWNGFPGEFKLVADLRKSDLLLGRKSQLRAKVGKGADFNDYIVTLSDMPATMPTPGFFTNQNKSLCKLNQISMPQ